MSINGNDAMPVLECPNAEQLTQFMLGHLPPEQIDLVTEHVLDCSTCGEAIEQFDRVEDALLSELRSPEVQQPQRLAVECQRMIMRAEQALALLAGGSFQLRDMEAFLHSHEYRGIERVGQGGMGAVFKAVQPYLERPVAIKVLPPEFTRNERASERFRREMQAIGKLHHPNIVTAYDAREIEGQYYLVMELVDGIDLAALARRAGLLPVADACELVRQAALGLQHVHEHGLVHRDIKPSNLMLNTRGQVKILDLGLALLTHARQQDGELTGSQQVLGTVDYMAPEQFGDSHAVDRQADIYSLGCTLFRLLNGEPPFSGPEYDTPLKKGMAHVSRPAPPLGALRPTVPAALSDIVARMLAKQPADRLPSAGEAARVLEPFTTGHDLQALMQTVSAAPNGDQAATIALERDATPRNESRLRSNVAARPVAPPATVRLPARRPRQRTRAVALALTVAAILGIGAVITVVSRQGTVVIETEDPDVVVEIRQNGRLVRVADIHNHWTATVKSGVYELHLRGGEDRVQLTDKSLLVRRGDKNRVRLAITRTSEAATASETGENKMAAASGVADRPVSPRIEGIARPLVPRPAAIEGLKSWSVELLAADPKPACVVAWSSAGKRLASVRNQQLIVWDLATAGVQSFRPSSSTFWSVAFAPRGQRIATADWDGGVIIWDIALSKGKRLSQHGARTVAFSPAGTMLAIATISESVELWDLALDKHVATLSLEAPTVPTGGAAPWRMHAVAWSPRGERIVSGRQDGSVRLWDVKSGSNIGTLIENAEPVRSVAWSSDGTCVAAGDAGGLVRVWHVKENRLIGKQQGLPTLTGSYGYNRAPVAWSPVENVLAFTQADGRIGLLEVAEGGVHPTSFEDSAGTREGYLDLSWSADGRYLASTESRNIVRVWDVDAGAQRLTLAPSASVGGFIISSQGHYTGLGSEEDDLVYVARTQDGIERYTPAEFSSRYGWQNDPAQVPRLKIQAPGR